LKALLTAYFQIYACAECCIEQECFADEKNERSQQRMLGKEFDNILRQWVEAPPPSTAVPVMGQGVQEQWLTELDGGY